MRKFIFLVFCLLVLTSNAHAYLDANTGSILIQVIAASFFSSLIFFRSWFRALKKVVGQFLKRNSNRF